MPGRVAGAPARTISAEQAAGLVRSGMWLDYGVSLCQPDVFDVALAARKDELQKVKIASNLITYPYAFLQGDYVGHITYYSGYFGPLERMFLPQGNVVPFPMHLSKAHIALERAKANDICLCEVTPPDERGYMNYGPCGIAYGRFATNMCKKVIAQVKEIIASVTKDFEFIIDDLQLPYEISAHDPFVAAFVRAARKCGQKAQLKGSDGATVISFFQHHGIVAFATGFGKSGTLHADDEYAEIRTLCNGMRVLEQFIKDYDAM